MRGVLAMDVHSQSSLTPQGASWLDGPPSVYRLLVMARTHLRRLKDARADVERIADAEAAVLVLEKAAWSEP